MAKAIRARLTSKIEILENGCWQWTGALDISGYARVCYEKRNWKASRLIWTLENGAIPKGLFVLHRCDNRKCINLSHLFLGTNLENMADMRAKNRSPRARAKLTEGLVKKMRLEFASGVSQNALGEQFGVSTGTVYQIVTRRTWSHI